MMLRGHICSLRAVEPQDLELLCRWENDPSLWTVSGTIEPFSHYSIEQFIQEQQAGIYRCGQLRLMIDDTAGETIGAIDLFDFEPQHERAGVGILVYDPAQRGKGYGAEALALLEEYARTVLRLRQLWCNVLADNVPSLTLFATSGFFKHPSHRLRTAVVPGQSRPCRSYSSSGKSAACKVRADCCFLVGIPSLRSRSPQRTMLSLPVQSRL